MNTQDFDRKSVLRIQHLSGVEEDGDFGNQTLAGVLETLELAAKVVPTLIARAVQTSGNVILDAPIAEHPSAAEIAAQKSAIQNSIKVVTPASAGGDLGIRIVLEAARYIGLTEVVGNRKWDNLKTPGADPIADELVRVLAAAGWEPGWAYCAAFCEAVWRAIYKGTPLLDQVGRVLNPHCLTTWRNAKAAGWTSKTPVPGAIGIMQKGTSEDGHALIVEKVPGNGWIHTIEANTSPNAGTVEADRNGDGIYRKTRVISLAATSGLHLLGFILPPGLKA